MKNYVKRSPFKNVKDVKKVVHSAFDSITPDMVRNCYEHVKDLENKCNKMIEKS